MSHYHIAHKVKNFEGELGGLNFTEGEAVLDSDNTSHLGNKTLEEAIASFEAKGCKVSIERGEEDVRAAGEAPAAGGAG